MERLRDSLFTHEIEYLLDSQVNLFKTLSNKNRLKIIYLLRINGTMSITELRRELDLSKATMSGHISLLKHAGVIASYVENRNMYVSLNCSEIKELCVLVESLMKNNLKIKVEELSQLKF